MQPHGQFDAGVDAGRNDAALKRAESGRPGRARVQSLAALPGPAASGPGADRSDADRDHLRPDPCNNAPPVEEKAALSASAENS